MISGDRWMFMWRSAPESWSFTQLVSQSPRANHMTEPGSHHDHPSPESLRRTVLAAAEDLAGVASGNGGRTPITLERPRRAEFGDYSTNAALLMAPGAGVPP